MSGGISAPCWLATPVAHIQLKPVKFGDVKFGDIVKFDDVKFGDCGFHLRNC